MAYCDKCGKETREGQIYCDECLSEMEDNTFSDLLDSLDMQPELEETLENSSEDDFEKIVEELQGPKEEIVEDEPILQEESKSPTTVSDVFSDAVSAISSLEDEFEELNQNIDIAQEEPVKKKGFFARLFKKKDESTEINIDDESKPGDQLSKKAKKEQAKKEKAERARSKKEAALKKKEEKAASKKSASGDGDDENVAAKKKAKKDKKAKAKKQKKAKPAKKEKPKKAKEKKVKQKPQEVIEEDLGHFNKPAMIIVFTIFIALAVFIIIQVNLVPYKNSIEVATRKFQYQKYDQAYDEIAGLKIRKSDEKLYQQIMTVMYVEKQVSSYNNYMQLEMYPEALDSLLKGLKRYDKYIDQAKELGVDSDLKEIRKSIIKKLKKKFDLSEKEAKRLIGIEDQELYSSEVYHIVLENPDYVLE